MNMQIGGINIEQTHSIELLGVNFDSDLNFSNQSGVYKVKSANWSTHATKESTRNTYSCQISTIQGRYFTPLAYCSTVCHFCRASDRRKLERLQERALRTVFNSTSDSYENLLLQANLTTLYNGGLQDRNNILPKYLQDLFNLNGEREKLYNLRNSDFTLPRFNTIKCGIHPLKYLGPFFWSKLTKEERGMDSVSTFKRGIRKRDLTHPIEDGAARTVIYAILILERDHN